MALTALPSLRSRTVPMKLHTAPTPASSRRSAAISAATSKSCSWIVTRAPMLASAAGHRREERDLAAFAQHRVVGAHDLVERHAHGTAARQRGGPGFAPRDQ